MTSAQTPNLGRRPTPVFFIRSRAERQYSLSAVMQMPAIHAGMGSTGLQRHAVQSCAVLDPAFRLAHRCAVMVRLSPARAYHRQFKAAARQDRDNPDRKQWTLQRRWLIAIASAPTPSLLPGGVSTSTGDDHRLVASSPGRQPGGLSRLESASAERPYRSARRFRRSLGFVPVRSPAAVSQRSRASRNTSVGRSPASEADGGFRRAGLVVAGCSAVLVVRRRRRIRTSVAPQRSGSSTIDSGTYPLARRRMSPGYDSRSSAGVQVYPASQCSSGARCSVVFIHLSVGLRRVRRAVVDRALPCSRPGQADRGCIGGCTLSRRRQMVQLAALAK